MKSLHKLRQQLGITQRDLATFLGKEYTQVHRIEKGERTLNDANMQAWLLLHQAATTAPVLKQKESPSKELCAEWQYRAEGCRVKMMILQKQLTKLELQSRQCQALLQCVANLRTMPGLNARQQRWLDTQQHDASRKLQRSGIGPQTALNIRIALLQKEAELLEKAARQ